MATTKAAIALVNKIAHLIIVDSPDEKKQPAIEIRGKNPNARKYHMPVHAHLMVQDGEMVSAAEEAEIVFLYGTKVSVYFAKLCDPSR